MLLVLFWTLGVGCKAVATASEIESIVEVLGLEAGMVVADVGAGDGDWALQLAERLGESGHLWATEVDQGEVEDLERRVDRRGLENVTVVTGSQSETGLPAACCDAILLRLVYHHFERPAEMRASLKRALRRGGVVAVIDITPQEFWRDLPEVPDRGGHGIEPDDLIAEMVSDGFRVVERRDRWNGDDDRFCVVFAR